MNIQLIKKNAVPIFKRYRVKRASVFGSVARGEATPKSDVDLLLEMPREASLFDFLALKNDLEDALHTPVDLVEYEAVKPALERYILTSQVPIYSL